MIWLRQTSGKMQKENECKRVKIRCWRRCAGCQWWKKIREGGGYGKPDLSAVWKNYEDMKLQRFHALNLSVDLVTTVGIEENFKDTIAGTEILLYEE